MSYVNSDDAGWTELRVHGVSGTPPEAMLCHPHAQRVAGNSQAGFYRRVWESQRIAEDGRTERLEAYSWGGLTSGDNRRALWLLLLPFMLLNVAFYMVPSRRAPTSDEGRRTDRYSASVQRLFALSFTVTFALVVVSVSMDLLGWQCGAGPAAGRPQVCAGGAGWLNWLGWSWLDSPGRQLAVTALLPLAAFLVLWRLAQNTWKNLERTDVAQVAEPKPETPLEDRAMWNGRQAVRRLRALHVAAGLAVPGVFIAAALLPDPSRGLGALLDGDAWISPAAVVRALALSALLALLVGVAVTVAWPTIAIRPRPAVPEAEPPHEARRTEDAGERRSPFRVLPWVALALTVTAGVAAWPDRAGAPTPGGGLPWLVGAVLGLFAVQVVLVLLLLDVCRRLRARAPRRQAAGPGGEVAYAPAWRGFGMPAVAVLSWLLAGGLSAGVVLRVADTLGQPVVEGQAGADGALVVPTAYYWVAVVGVAAGVAAFCVAGYAWYRLHRPIAAADLERINRAYPGAGADEDPNRERRQEIAGQWRQAQSLTGLARTLFGWFVAVAGGLVVAGLVAYLVVGTRLLTGAPLLVTVAGLALTAFVLAVLWIGRQAYRNPAFRRTVGIAWDLGTFWPRAVHPLAPPCYAERAIPDLLGRLELYAGTADDGRVLLSCHSQGSVLGAAALLQVAEPVSARASFLTYGSPVSRLYQRFFPAYFDRPTLERLGSFLACEPASGATNPRASWRWRNLYRPSDPIGGAVFAEHDAVLDLGPDHQAAGDRQDVDRQLIDPEFTRRTGDPCYPPTRGHSDYFADPAFAWTADALRDRRLPGHPCPTADAYPAEVDVSIAIPADAPPPVTEQPPVPL